MVHASTTPEDADYPKKTFNSSNSKTKKNSNPPSSSCFKTWMTDNQNQLQSKKLTQLSIPGSHDAGMYKSIHCFPDILPKKYHQYGPSECNTRTQTETIGGQLRLGVRYFDLRPIHTTSFVVTKKKNKNKNSNEKEIDKVDDDAGGVFYSGHFSNVQILNRESINCGCLGEQFSDILKDIQQFSSMYPQELVILRFSHYYDEIEDHVDFSQDVMSSFINQVTSYLSDVLVRKKEKENDITTSDNHYHAGREEGLKLLEMSFGEILEYGSVIALFDDVDTDWNSGIFNSHMMPIYDSYSNTNNFDRMRQDQFDKLVREGNDPSQLFLLSWTLSQNTLEMTTCAFGETDSILDLAKIANGQLDLILKEQSRVQKIPNIIYTDWVDGTSTLVAMQSNGIGLNLYSSSLERRR